MDFAKITFGPKVWMPNFSKVTFATHSRPLEWANESATVDFGTRGTEN